MTMSLVDDIFVTQAMTMLNSFVAWLAVEMRYNEKTFIHTHRIETIAEMGDNISLSTL